MASCAVIDINTNEQVNFIVAEVTDPAPNGYKYVEIPNEHYWSQELGQVLPQAIQDIPQANQDLPQANIGIIQKIKQSVLNFFGITTNINQ